MSHAQGPFALDVYTATSAVEPGARGAVQKTLSFWKGAPYSTIAPQVSAWDYLFLFPHVFCMPWALFHRNPAASIDR